MDTPNLNLALVDDHRLFRKGLLGLLEVIGYPVNIVFEADNGLDMQKKIKADQLPEIILMDINMPHMNGFESVAWLNKNYPTIKVLVVSMVESEESIMKMLKLGVKGYLSKDVEPAELRNALTAIINKCFYYTDYITGRLLHTLQNEDANQPDMSIINSLNEKEKRFVQLACSDHTYVEIAAQMFVSPKTVDNYRESVFEKFRIKSRVALALFAVKSGLIKL
jgi:DNA-binding NarL/FixJ family response regulator